MLLVKVAGSGELLDEGPGEGKVSDEDGGAGLADVPCNPCRLVRLRETVVLVQDGGEDDKEAKGKDTAEDELALEWEEGADEHG